MSRQDEIIIEKIKEEKSKLLLVNGRRGLNVNSKRLATVSCKHF